MMTAAAVYTDTIGCNSRRGAPLVRSPSSSYFQSPPLPTYQRFVSPALLPALV
ncbi:hypothetical protein QCA50_015478 [Cerrena zonata]|uniref:Uncharacterized protein n=1 Tax=Cerrena zonata TaxID=2478898 RepID=A0AAW0FKX3_9APHY